MLDIIIEPLKSKFHRFTNFSEEKEELREPSRRAADCMKLLAMHLQAGIICGPVQFSQHSQENNQRLKIKRDGSKLSKIFINLARVTV